MKNYEVTLMATSFKTVMICANSEKEAEDMAMDIYKSTDALDFGDEDVEDVEVDANEEDDTDEEDGEDGDEDEDDTADVLLRFVQAVRDSDMSDEKVAEIMQRKIEKDMEE